MEKTTLADKIGNKIDHYTPYRPITDSLEAQLARKVLIEVSEDVKEFVVRLKYLIRTDLCDAPYDRIMSIISQIDELTGDLK